LEKSKFSKEINNKSSEKAKLKPNNKLLYTQSLASKVSEILKIKEKFTIY